MDEGILKEKIREAKKAEKQHNFFHASYFYRDALDLAIKLKDPKQIKFCKNKIIETNKQSLSSGKDFKKISAEYKVPEEKKEIHEKFIKKFLRRKSIKDILQAIGDDSSFLPKVRDIEAMAGKTIPLSHQIAGLTTFSTKGHILKGSTDGKYSWFIQIYDLNQQLIMRMYLGRIIYEITENKPNGIHLNFENLFDYFSKSGVFDKDNLEIIKIGLQGYFNKDYVSAIHILVPQFEAAFLKVSENSGIDIIALDQKKGISTRTRTLGEQHLELEELKGTWGEDFCRQLKFVLFEQMGHRIRHKIAHGEIKPSECNFENTTLILYFYLVILRKDSKSGDV